MGHAWFWWAPILIQGPLPEIEEACESPPETTAIEGSTSEPTLASNNSNAAQIWTANRLSIAPRPRISLDERDHSQLDLCCPNGILEISPSAVGITLGGKLFLSTMKGQNLRIYSTPDAQVKRRSLLKLISASQGSGMPWICNFRYLAGFQPTTKRPVYSRSKRRFIIRCGAAGPIPLTARH